MPLDRRRGAVSQAQQSKFSRWVNETLSETMNRQMNEAAAWAVFTRPFCEFGLVWLCGDWTRALVAQRRRDPHNLSILIRPAYASQFAVGALAKLLSSRCEAIVRRSSTREATGRCRQ